MRFREKLVIGIMGALTPILLNLVVVDLSTTLAQVTPISVATYLLRVVGLCFAGGVVIWLNAEEDNKRQLFQLGLAAPALLTAMINGSNVPSQAQRSLIFGTAHAQQVDHEDFGIKPTKNCRPPELTIREQVLKGLLGRTFDKRWFVIVGSYAQKDLAERRAAEINERYHGAFEAQTYKPTFGNYYPVVVGCYLTREEAESLRADAVRAGLPPDSYLWHLPARG
jgi:hypothetical protein